MPFPYAAFVPNEPKLTDFAEKYEAALTAFQHGELDAETFRTTRITHGVHSQRPPLDTFMVRIKVPCGALSSQQLLTLAAIARETPEDIHITSRESIEFHGVPLADTAAILRRAAEVGLTSREAGGNSIRNVAACPLAGICPLQPFDMRPSMRDFIQSEIGNQIIRMLPRKFKVAFSGCGQDCALVRLHDVGSVAIVQNGQPGFRVYVGGGMGGVPIVGEILAAFVPEKSLSNLILAIAQVFDRLGERRNRERARIKFLINEIGLDLFREEVRKVYEADHGDIIEWLPESGTAEAPPGPLGQDTPAAKTRSLWHVETPPAGVPAAWVRAAVRRQHPAGLVTVFLNPCNGDVTAAEAEQIAYLADTYGTGELAVTQSQQVLIRNVREELLAEIYGELTRRNLVLPQTLATTRVVACPGSETCNLGLTRARDLAIHLRDHLAVLPAGVATSTHDLAFGIRVNGCANSCCHIRVAPLALMGSTAKVNNQSVPMYSILLGGNAEGETVQWSTPVIRLPVRMIPDAVERLLKAYHDERAAEETFSAWAIRKFALQPHTPHHGGTTGVDPNTKPTAADHASQRAHRAKIAEEFFHGLGADNEHIDTDMLHDWGTSETYSWSVGRAECDNMPVNPLEKEKSHAPAKRTVEPAWEVTPNQVETWLGDASVRFIDVRTVGEYEHGHVPGAEWMPVEQFQAAATPKFAADEKVVLICRTGHRSMDVCTLLRNAGLEQAYSMRGGILAWRGAWAN